MQNRAEEAQNVRRKTERLLPLSRCEMVDLRSRSGGAEKWFGSQVHIF